MPTRRMPAPATERIKARVRRILIAHVGPEQAITAQEISELIGCHVSSVTQAVQYLTVDGDLGHLVASRGTERWARGAKGYFMAPNSAMLLDYARTLESRVQEIQERADAARSASRRMEEMARV